MEQILDNRKNDLAVFEKFNIKSEDILASLKSDMKNTDNFGVCMIAATKYFICAASEDGFFIRIDYADIEDISAENYVSSGAVMVTKKYEDVLLASYSLKKAAEVSSFISSVKRIMAGKQSENQSIDLIGQDDFINKGRKKLFLRVLSYAPRYMRQTIIVVLTVLAAGLINVVQPYLTGKILYDEVLNPKGRFAGHIFALVTVLIAISAATTFLSILQGRIGAELSGRVIFDIKTEVFSSMQKLGMKFFSSKRTGNLLNRINSDALDLQYFLNDGLPAFLINAITITAVGLVLFVKNPTLSVAVLIPVPLIAIIIKKSTRRFKKLKWQTWHKSSALNSIINDTLLGIRVVKAFGREEKEIKRFESAGGALYRSKLREGVAAAQVFPFLNWIMTLGGLIVWGLGGAQVLGGSLSFGELMTFVGYLSLLYAPVNFMVKTFDWWTNCMNSAQRIFEITDRKTDVPEAENPIELKNIRGEIELKNVTFAYEPNRNVLKDVSFKILPGEMVGLVGHSGAGKSTITNIITRLYDVNEGEVLIDGVNVKDIKTESLHSQIGMVLQETFLFSGTIAENIAYARPNASMEEIVSAAKRAYAHEFIMNLPDGYQTEIGRRGINLSGGEKQRISIARAILMNPPILILDEATASLDTQTEQKIQKALDELVKGRTTVAIAHRLSTLKNAQRLIVVEDGRIVEEGTHKELFSKADGHYFNMAKKQLEALRLYNLGGENVE